MLDKAPDALRRYSRQVILPDFGVVGQESLLKSRVVILGVGALGTNLASAIVRAGVGYVRLVDRDFIEEHNLQRQVLFDEDDIKANLPKAIAAAEKLRRINHQVTIEPIVTDINPDNIESLIGDCDLILDGADNFELRMLLNDACIKHHMPWIYGAVIGTYGMTMPILPDGGPCFRCFITDLPAPGSTPTCDTAGVLGTAPQVIAAFQVTEALKLLTGNQDRVIRKLRYVDLWHGDFEELQVIKAEGECPACQLHQFEFLEGKYHTRSETLCGRDAVQVKPKTVSPQDLGALAQRLAQVGEVQYNAYLLRLKVGGYNITFFKDGRAIIYGTHDEAIARSVYAQYFGL
jgi:molybdopterin/thiamine biosynthesis adenylyltransferase